MTITPSPPAPRTSVVTVCYNSTAVLPALLASLPPEGAEVLLVDNASRDGKALDRIAAAHHATVIRSAVNRGFGAGCNLGAAAARGEFLFFLNPDTSLAPGTIAELEAAMDRNPRTSAMNPRLSDGQGRPYFKRRSVLLPRRQWLHRGWPAAETEVPVLTGAALFVRRAAFEAVGGFDERIFLYHEDDDLSLRLAAASGPLMFIPTANVRHLEGHSTVRSAETAAFKARHLGQSRVYAAQKHGRPLPRLGALGEALARLLIPWEWFSPRKRARNIAFLCGVLAAAPADKGRDNG